MISEKRIMRFQAQYEFCVYTIKLGYFYKLTRVFRTHIKKSIDLSLKSLKSYFILHVFAHFFLEEMYKYRHKVG